MIREAATSNEGLRTLTVEEVAEVLGLRREAVRLLVREGRLEAMRWGRRLHVRPEALRRFQESCTVAVPDLSFVLGIGRHRPAGPGGRGHDRA